MRYFNGFYLKDDEKFFSSFLEDNDFYVYGFSYGAIKALRYVINTINKGKRVDKLILLSPAFFQTKEKKFIKLQLISFKKDKKSYIDNFLKSCFLPYNVEEILLNENDGYDELKELLEYKWIKEDFKILKDKNVIVEVYLGGEDKIIDTNGAFEFFYNVANVTFIKKANHFLQIKGE
jgi:hypothetical protein